MENIEVNANSENKSLASESTGTKGRSTEATQVDPQSKISNIAYDYLNKEFISIQQKKSQVSSEVDKKDEESTGDILLFNEKGNSIKKVPCQMIKKNQNLIDENTDSQNQRSYYSQASSSGAVDNMNVLRFIKSHKAKGIEISPSGILIEISQFLGLTLKLMKGQQKKANEAGQEELVLTNMAFSSGLHFWEFQAPISCQNLQMGVYNPVTKQELLNSFKTSTMRVITVCLDFNDESLKFWLNDRRNQQKTLRLPRTEEGHSSGPWIPCVKISGDRNKIILNPYAKEPSDLYEKEFDKKLSLKKYVMPLLHNMICILKLALDTFKLDIESQSFFDTLKLNKAEVQSILMQKIEDEQSSNENERFCFVKFHDHYQAAEFIRKSNNLEICQQAKIASWICEENEESQPQYLKASEFIKKALKIPKSSQEQLKQSFLNLKNTLNKKIEQVAEQNSTKTFASEVICQSFTDKLMIIQDNKALKLISRDRQTHKFDSDRSCFVEGLESLHSNAHLILQNQAVELFFNHVNWALILKDADTIGVGLLTNFFSQVTQTFFKNDSAAKFSVDVVTTKYTLDLAQKYMRSQLEKLKRLYQNNQTIIPSQSLVKPSKLEVSFDLITNEEFEIHQSLSVDEIYAVLFIINDLQEQLWAQSRGTQSNSELLAFMQSVSRGKSAFSRLGSLIRWGLGSMDQLEVAELGYIFKENHSISLFDSLNLEIYDLNKDSLTQKENLISIYGHGNRFLNGELSENIPLCKTLNYLPAKNFESFKSGIQDIIPSQNNVFSLVVLQNGQLILQSNNLDAVQLKKINFFSAEFSKKKLSEYLKKVQLRISQLQEFNKTAQKKLVPLSVLKGKNPIQAPQSFKDKKSALEKNLTHAISKHKSKGKKQAKATKVNQKTVLHDEVVAVESDDEQKPKQKEDIVDRVDLLLDSLKAENVKIIGNFLLSKPYIEKALDPITIGCIFQNMTSKKFYIRVLKLSFSLSYLHSFIHMDGSSGLIYNRLTGKQIEDCENLQNIYEDILNSVDSLTDLIPLFLQKEKASKSMKTFYLLESTKASIEIEDCTEIIDYTRCSYSIVNQERVHLLIKESQSQKIKLLQYNIKSEAIDNMLNYKLTLMRGKEMEIENQPRRVFQYEDLLCLVSENEFQIINQGNFKIEKTEKLADHISDFQKIEIVNKTQPDQIYTRSNISNFKIVESVSTQRWELSILDTNSSSIKSHSLSIIQETENTTETDTTINQDERRISLAECEASDIIQIPDLVQSQACGIVSQQNQSSVSISSLVDQTVLSDVQHTWLVTNNSAENLEFQFKVFREKQQDLHLKELDIKLSLVKQTEDKVRLRVLTDKEQSDGLIKDHSEQRLPLIVEYNSGSQINDALHTCQLTNPDSTVFCTNYSQPEFILKHIHEHSFIPTQFIIRSKENREQTGVPIGLGLIFISNTLQDLHNTKAFNKFTKDDYIQWRKTRDQLKDLPLLPNEPVAFFEMEDMCEVLVNIKTTQSFKYIKLLPLGFREAPINFTSKPYNKNQLEIQFFGVNGYDIGFQQTCNNTETSNSSKVQKVLIQDDLKVPIKGEIVDSAVGPIASFSDITLESIKGPRPENQQLNLASLINLNLPYTTYEAGLKLVFNQNQSETVSDLKLILDPNSVKGWKISQVKVQLSRFSSDSCSFRSQQLLNNKSFLRQCLVDDEKFEYLLDQLLSISKDDSVPFEKRGAALLCIVKHQNQRNSQGIARMITSKVDIQDYLTDTFVNYPKAFQYSIFSFLEGTKILNKDKSSYILDYLNKSVALLLDNSRPIQQVNQLFSFCSYLSIEDQETFNKALFGLLKNEILLKQLPALQSEDYIRLRSKLNLNYFPFDDLSTGQKNTDSSKESDQLTQVEASFSVLDSQVLVSKYNNLNQFSFDLLKRCDINKLTLSFEQDQKALYKMIVRVTIPDANGREELVFSKYFDEMVYQQLCEKAYNPRTHEYFHQRPNEASNVNADETVIDKESLQNNKLALHLNLRGIRYFRVQIEFMDTYRTISKIVPMTQIFIKPEVFGKESSDQSELPLKQIALFKLPEIEESLKVDTLKANQDKNITEVYLISSSQMSHTQKQCILKIKNQDNGEQKSKNKSIKEKLNKQTDEETKTQREEIINLQAQLRTQLQKPRCAKNNVRVMAQLIEKLQKTYNSNHQQPLTLQYVLKLSETIAEKLLYRNESKVLDQIEDTEVTPFYLSLFQKFSIFDIKHLYPSIHKILEKLFERIPDKSQFVCRLFSEYMLSPSTSFSQKNVIAFIRSMKNLSFNEIIHDFAQIFNIQISSEEESKEVRSFKPSDIEEIIKELEAHPPQNKKVSMQACLAFFSIIEDIPFAENKAKLYRIDTLIEVVVQLFQNLDQEQSTDGLDSNIYLIQYGLQVIKKYLSFKGINSKIRSARSQTDIIKLLMMAYKKNSKDIFKATKHIILALAIEESIDVVSLCITGAIQWFSDQDNEVLKNFYSQFGEDSQSTYYRQYVKTFKLLDKIQMKMNDQKTGESRGIKFDIESLVSNLLVVLDDKQDDPQYEEKFFFIWKILYNFCLGGSNREVTDKIIQRMFKLKPVLLESLYPILISKTEKTVPGSNPQLNSAIISVIKSLIKAGFTRSGNSKHILNSVSSFEENAAYNFVDQLLNILLTNSFSKSTALILQRNLEADVIKNLSDLLCWYLQEYINDGNYTGVNGALQLTNIKLKIANKIAKLLDSPCEFNNEQESNFQKFLQKAELDSEFDRTIDTLIQWSFHNFIINKSKSSPSGQLIVSLSQIIESILSKISVRKEAVHRALPILMRNVLKIDYKLRDLVQSDTINQNKALQIQKNVNEIFLLHFKSWISTDEVAKSFLIELQGFDFLLDRLFSLEQATATSPQKGRVIEEIKQDSTGLDQKTKDSNDDISNFLFPIDEVIVNAESSEDEEGEEENQLLEMVLEKLQIKKLSKENQKKELVASPSVDKKDLKKLPKMVKQEGIKTSEQAVAESNDNDQNQKLEQKLNLDDWGKHLTLLSCSDKKPIPHQPDSSIWIKYKSGLKYRVHNTILGDESYEQEMIYEFDLGQVLQISEIQTGLVFNWTTYDADQNYEPLTLIVEGGVEKDQSDFKAMMIPLRDYGYEMSQIRPYGTILNPLSGDLRSALSFEDQLAKFTKKQARYLRLRFRRVIQTNLDSSTLITQVSKPKSFGLSFFSVLANQSVNQSQLYNYMLELQKENSLEVLSKFFSGQFTQAFEIISEQPQIIEKIKNAFDKLAVLFDTKADLIKPIFLAICSKNEALGDWIMQNRLLKLSMWIKKEQLKFLGDIISSNRDSQYIKLLTLKEFIFSSLKLVQYEHLHDEEILSLFRKYVKLFISKIKELSNYLADQGQENCDLEIPVTKEEFESIMKLMSSTQIDQALLKTLIQLIVVLINPPLNFKNSGLTALQLTETLLQPSSDGFDSQIQKLVISILAAVDKETLDHLLKTDFIQELIDQITSISDQLSHNKPKADAKKQSPIKTLAQYIYNLCEIPETLKILISNYRDMTERRIIDFIYCKCLNRLRSNQIGSSIADGENDSEKKNKQEIMLHSSIDEEALTLLVDSLKTLLIECEADQSRYSTILQEDMKKASELGDVRFISKVLVPLLHSEKLINITLSVSDLGSDGQLQREKPFFQGQKTVVKQDTFFLKTNLLNQNQKRALEKSFNSITQDHLDAKSLMKSKWNQIYSEQNIVSKNSADFVKFAKALSNKSNLFFLLKAKVNDNEVIYGGFTAQQFPNLSGSITQEFDYQIPYAESNFVFSYLPDKELHFTLLHQKPFGYVYTDYENSGALSISGDFFLVSWSHEFSSNCGNIYDMKCIEDPSAMSQYSNMTILEFEVWHSDSSSKSQSQQVGNIKSELKKISVCNQNSPLNYSTDNLIFKVSQEYNLQQISNLILGRDADFLKFDSIVFDQEKLNEANTKKLNELRGQQTDLNNLFHSIIFKKQANNDDQKTDAQQVSLKIQPNKPILEAFIQKGGIVDLIAAARTSVGTFKNQEIQSIWGLWLQEIDSFNLFPNFYNLFSQDQDKEKVIYQLLAGENDIQASGLSENEIKKQIKAQEELHLELITYTYKILGELFDKQESSELREMCLKSGTFLRFIERIGQLSSEKKRTKVDGKKEEPTVDDKNMLSQSSDTQKNANAFEQDKKNKVRKGVGYTTGNGTAWNVSEYLKSKESKNQQIANIMNILARLIKPSDWQAPQEVKEMILESALLPALEAGFRSGSLLEMAKDFELNISFLQFVIEMSNHSNLIDLLIDIGEDYEPRQKDSIFELLKKIGSLSSIFLSCLKTDGADKSTDTEESQKPKILAEKILATLAKVDEKLKANQSFKNQQSLKEVLDMPLSEAYHKLLSDLRFENMSMKNSAGVYSHYYVHDIPKGLNPPVAKLVRLAQEIADLSNSLPCDWTNAIFCRVDNERVDVMKCLIMGAAGTPYAHGAFVYDLFFENTYPNGPPKCTLVTTGGGTVRFNPNLYTNGKVCLSLLGTWRGSSTENWDPKLSTILQVLLSIQAIIMSNEVYFNEPGYEHEQGTEEGEKKNEGYANIVRYCNVKFAMIDAIKNPPAGFEKVIKRSFYLKKNEILKEVKEWVDRAKVTDATYQGLVYDHNYHWAPQISPEGKYYELMQQVYKELKEALEAIPSPFEDESGVQIQRKFSNHLDSTEIEGAKKTKDAKTVTEAGQNVLLDDIDVSFAQGNEETNPNQKIDILDEKVKDRWSRYIGAMGIEAVAKQAESRILIHGLDALGVEIAKNIILAGCKELILDDKSKQESFDINGQFFIEEKDTKSGLTLDQINAPKLRQLNSYVKVSIVDQNVSFVDYIKEQKDLRVIVISKLTQSQHLHEINQICRDKGISFIYAAQNGVFSKVFTDFGPEFIVIDKDGEELQEVLIKDIFFDEKSNSTIVQLLDGYKHRYQDGDVVSFKEVKGMVNKNDMTKSINDASSKIQVINPTSFKISDVDAREYSSYEGSGIAKQIKVPVSINFKTLEEIEQLEAPLIDQNLHLYDFSKMDNQIILHEIYKAVEKIISPSAVKIGDLSEELKTIKGLENLSEKLVSLCKAFAASYRTQLPPVCAYLGGVVSQEIVKAITQKYMPINQLFYFDVVELISTELIDGKESIIGIENEKPGPYESLTKLLGKDLMQKVLNCKLFMIGAGAIGCELLKNYAMLGLGTGAEGSIILTDPDVIEVSNLNRQFLFREKHLRQPKSSTAAAAAIQMNPQLKSHIHARLDKIHDGTAHIYDEGFFKQQTIVTNALDNVAARLYIDGKCVAARTTLIDSGTLGPKGHVQIVLPGYFTESYASQQDPEDNNEIPHCTLKMFPEEILHCIEWAKDLFGKLFTLKPQIFNKYVESDQPINFADQQEMANLKKALKTFAKEPANFKDCVEMARARFQKHFVNDIKQLLHVYPIDKQTKDGRPFWSLPKRPPHAVEFDKNNQTHVSFVASCACLIATIYNCEMPFSSQNIDPRSKEARAQIAEMAEQFVQPEFVPNDLKASEIQLQVEKDPTKESEKPDQEEESCLIEGQASGAQVDKNAELESLKKDFEAKLVPIRELEAQEKQAALMKVQEFEKDVDSNFHIDFIHAMANIRAQNYNLDGMEWIDVKIKAGKIIPALATTTAAIAGLQTLEVLKYLKDCKLEEHKNSFMNLAVPSLMMSEPGPAAKVLLTDELLVTLWDRWQYNGIANPNEVTLWDVMVGIEQKTKLQGRDVFLGSQPLFLHALEGRDEASRKKNLQQALLIKKLPGFNDGASFKVPDFVDLTITFVEEGKLDESGQEKKLEGVPRVRVYLSDSFAYLFE